MTNDKTSIGKVACKWIENLVKTPIVAGRYPETQISYMHPLGCTSKSTTMPKDSFQIILAPLVVQKTL